MLNKINLLKTENRDLGGRLALCSDTGEGRKVRKEIEVQIRKNNRQISNSENLKMSVNVKKNENKVRAKIDKIIEEEGYENLRHDWKRLCNEVIGYHPKEAVRILQVLQQTKKTSIVNQPPHPA